MTWLASIWAKIAGAAVALLALAGFVALRDRRLRRAGAEAERAKQREAVLQHERKTSDQVRQSDEAVADPKSPRAQRIRRRFERDDDARP